MNARTPREVRIGAVVDYVLGKPVKNILQDWRINPATLSLSRFISDSDFISRRADGRYGSHYGPHKRLMS